MRLLEPTAFDVTTGEVVWTHVRTYPDDIGASEAYPRHRGVSIYGDVIYWGTADSFLVALDARTGEVVAETLAFGEMTGYRAFDPANGLVLEVRPQTTDTGPLRFGFDLTGYVSRALTMLVCDHVLVAFDDEGQRIDGEPLD